MIACTEPCIYQTDGICTLSCAGTMEYPGTCGCINYMPLIPEESQQSRQRITDI